jgi:heat shock protein HtpX
MATLYTHQSSNIVKTWALMTGFFLLVMFVGWAISLYTGNTAILPIAVGFAIVMNVWSYWFSDTVVIKLTGAKPADPTLHREYIRAVENLAITAGLPMPKVYVVEDPAPNAFATGRNPQHSAVAATTGLLSILDKTELEGVIAHELAHIGNRDMLVSTIAVVLVGFLSIIADMFLRMGHLGGGRDRDRGGVFLILAIIGIILAPIAGQMIQLAISRKREYLADASGALLTRYPEGLARALEKISSYGRPMARANNATAHLFIANPFGPSAGGIGKKISALFATHPPAEDRIKVLRSMGDI